MIIMILALVIQVFSSINLIQNPVSLMKRPQQLTALTEQELFEALKEGHIRFFGKEASLARLASAWAHVGLENGQGSKIYNFNFGNIGSSKKEPYFFIGGHAFKANDSVQDGSVAYWKTIKKMCSSVLPHFDVGNPKNAAYQLYRCGYYRANKEDYAQSMNLLYWKAIKEYSR